MTVDMTKLVTPPTGVPDLPRAGFEWVISTRTPGGLYLADIIETVLLALKSPNPDGYRTIRSRLASQRFRFDEVMEMIDAFGPILAQLFPGEDFSADAILVHWNAALAHIEEA